MTFLFDRAMSVCALHEVQNCVRCNKMERLQERCIVLCAEDKERVIHTLLDVRISTLMQMCVREEGTRGCLSERCTQMSCQ